MAKYSILLNTGGTNTATVGPRDEDDAVCLHEKASGQKFTNRMVQLREVDTGDKICFARAQNPDNPCDGVPREIIGKTLIP